MSNRQEAIIYVGLAVILIGAYVLTEFLRTGIFLLALGASLVALNIRPGADQ